MFSSEGLASFCSGNAEIGHRLVYNLELYFRLMLRWELVGNSGKGWKSVLGSLYKEASDRRHEESQLRIIDVDSRNLLSYLMLSELKDIITSEAVWPLFKDRWPPQDIFLAEFKIFNQLRHKAAHFRPLTDRDMRQLEKFKVMVVEMSAHYRQQRRGAKLIIAAEQLEKLPEEFQNGIQGWAADCAAQDGRWSDLVVKKMGKYLVVDVRLRAGSFAPRVVSRLVDDTGCDAIFLSINFGTGALRIYIPFALKADEAKLMLNGIKSFQSAEEDLVGDDFDLMPETFDFVMPYEVELPMDFRF
ncbi:hypothetical protein CK218_12745 [Mesorhizobium sp. WSM3879]|uniref:hypothetical protein n=1 Tax=Mesorhizobium sp. WSM3879 TaxID=2029406 RepID=UPI000BAF7D86|nr:hypothetical protein [Mesorhizobium sp. WSM3879]PBB81229.1 hypothetical protein CK218_12745 [Mesorhizobium sp. WSM3879]